ncbi:hypothetical protein QBC42DRAFT_263318, partial [Cladorrhinum samala]
MGSCQTIAPFIHRKSSVALTSHFFFFFFFLILNHPSPSRSIPAPSISYSIAIPTPTRADALVLVSYGVKESRRCKGMGNLGPNCLDILPIRLMAPFSLCNA